MIYYNTFNHDANALTDSKLIKLRMKYGMLGYGVYWALLEQMYVKKDLSLSFDDIDAVAFLLGLEEGTLTEIIRLCIDVDLFKTLDNSFFSSGLQQRKEQLEQVKTKKKEAGKKGMESRWNKQKDNTAIDNYNTTITENNTAIDNYNYNYNRIDKEKKRIEKNKIDKDKDKDNSYMCDFEKFWSVYPKKVDKKDSEKAFVKAIKIVDVDLLISAIQQQKKTTWLNIETRFIPAAAVWLNKERWNDEITTAKGVKSNAPTEEDYMRGSIDLSIFDR